jgi:hypothetical protein
MDDVATAAVAALSFTSEDYAIAWRTTLLDTRTAFPPDADWDAFAGRLTERSRDLGLPDDRIEAFLRHVTSAGNPHAVIEQICAEPRLTPDRTDDYDTDDHDTNDYDQNAWYAFLADEGRRWDGFADTWPVFREWFVHTARERGFGPPATALMSYVEAAPSPWRAMVEYGVQINPLADFPMVVKLASCTATEDGLRRFLSGETGIDFTTVEA